MFLFNCEIKYNSSTKYFGSCAHQLHIYKEFPFINNCSVYQTYMSSLLWDSCYINFSLKYTSMTRVTTSWKRIKTKVRHAYTRTRSGNNQHAAAFIAPMLPSLVKVIGWPFVWRLLSICSMTCLIRCVLIWLSRSYAKATLP